MATSHSPGTRIRANDDVLFQDLNGEGVLLNLRTGVYFGLDRVGTRFWQLLESHSLVSDLVEAVVAEFDVTAEQCARDLMALTADMQQHGLVTLDEAPPADATR
jgi:hypothetical protein